MKEKIFNIIQIGDKSNIVSKCFDKLIISAILINIAVMFLQTFNYLEKYYTVFKVIEIVTIIIRGKITIIATPDVTLEEDDIVVLRSTKIGVEK